MVSFLKRRLWLLAIVIFVLAACRGKDAEKAANSNSPEPPEATPTFAFDITLNLWHPEKETSEFEKIIERFNQEYPEIQVNLEYHENVRDDFEQATRAGGGPDMAVIDLSVLSLWAESGLIIPFDQNLAQNLASDLPEPLFYSLVYQDQLWGIPFFADVLVMFSNKKLIETAPRTLDDLRSMAAEFPITLYPGAEGTIGLYVGSLPFMVDQAGKDVLLQLAIMEYLREYLRLSNTAGIQFSTDITSFTEDESGILIGYASQYSVLSAALDENLAMASLPQIDLASWRPLVHPIPIVISRNATETSVRASELFLAYLATPIIQQELLLAGTGLPEEMRDILWRQVNSSTANSAYPILETVILPVFDQALAAAVNDPENVESIAESALIQIRN